MTTRTAETAMRVSAPSNARTAVTAAGLAGALACAGSIAGWFLLSNLSKAEADKAPITVIECLIAGLAYVVLAVSLPTLAEGTRFPRWTVSFAAVACAFIAIQSWAFGTVIAHLASSVSAAQFDDLGEATFLLLLLSLPMMITSLVAFVTMAVVGWRRQAMPRGASVLLILAGVSALIGDFPPVGLLAGVAFVWTARSAKSY